VKKTKGVATTVTNGASGHTAHRRILEEKRRDVMVGLGIKFDSLANAGRVAEEDQAQMSHDEFISLSLNKQDYQVLKLVDEALDRLQNGDYGVCQRCEEAIAPRRLEVLPWAKYCVRCQDRIASRQFEEEDAPVMSNAW
jgi:RNA polymerase-binding transcription factor